MGAIQACAPELWRHLETIDAALGKPDEAKVIETVFDSIVAESIDYAVLEKAKRVLVAPTDPGWSDVGSWDSVAELHPADGDGNAVAEAPGHVGEVVAIDSEGCFVVQAPGSRRSIALIGARDLMVVDTGDAILICRKGASQSVREVVKVLAGKGRRDLL